MSAWPQALMLLLDFACLLVALGNHGRTTTRTGNGPAALVAWLAVQAIYYCGGWYGPLLEALR